MKIEKTKANDGIMITGINNLLNCNQLIWFENQRERDVVFDYWTAAIAVLNANNAVFRPVYETKDKDTQILKLRYTTPEEVISVEKARKENFPDTDMKLIMIYNEQERTFQNVN